MAALGYVVRTSTKYRSLMMYSEYCRLQTVHKKYCRLGLSSLDYRCYYGSFVGKFSLLNLQSSVP
jgi:hypothetical protein